MNGNRFPVAAQFAVFGGAILLLSGCTVTGPPQLESSGLGIPAGASVSIADPAVGSAMEMALASALTRAFASRNYQMTSASDPAGYRIEYSVAVRSADIGIARENGADVDWISRSRNGLLLDECDAQRLRMNVVAYDIGEATIAYRSAAEVDGCAFDQFDFSDLAKETAERVGSGG